jgi:hypothetical protein
MECFRGNKRKEQVMNYQNVFKRYELKYMIDDEQCELIKEAMKPYMKDDKYGISTIHNLYFDTPTNLLIRKSIEKPVYKEKLRVRSYRVTEADTEVFVELKKKYESVVYKRRISLSEDEAMQYLLADKKIEDSQIVREIDYFKEFYKDLRPAEYIYYDREAFAGLEDKNFRVTFDKNILCRDYDLSLDKGAYGDSILPEGKVLMEVKTATAIPLWMVEFLSKYKIYKTSFSKYGTAYALKMKG